MKYNYALSYKGSANSFTLNTAVKIALILCFLFTLNNSKVFTQVPESESLAYSFEHAFKNAKTVKEIAISDYIFEKLPDSIYMLENLESLIITDGNLTSIDSTLSKLSSLKTLAFWRCPISYIDSSISNLEMLKRLEVVSGNLTEVPSGIYQLKNLEVLNFLGNEIKVVEKEISNLNKLKQLNLSTWEGDFLISDEMIEYLENTFPHLHSFFPTE